MFLTGSHDSFINFVDLTEKRIKDHYVMSGFTHHQFLLADKPGYTIAHDMKETKFAANDVIFAAADQGFGIRCDGEMRLRLVAFSGSNILPIIHYCRFGRFCVISNPGADRPPLFDRSINELFNELFSIYDSHSDTDNTKASIVLYKILAQLGYINLESNNYILDKNSLMLDTCIKHMQANYKKPSISYDELLLNLRMDRTQLDALFEDVFLMDADSYYKYLRMENAKYLLFYYMERGIGFIAENLGYSDLKDFENDFYNQFSITADEFIHLYYG